MQSQSIFTHHELFDLICNKYLELQNKSSYKIEDIYFLIFSLHHLREWIVPGFKYQKNPPQADIQEFNKIFENESYELVLSLANHLKHLKKIENNPEPICRKDMIDDWPSLDDVSLISVGYVEFQVEGRNILQVIREVIFAYNDNYFRKALMF